MSLRLRLTLLYTALVVLVLVGFSSALYWGHSRRSRAMLEMPLAETAARMAQHAARGLEGPPGPPRMRPPVSFVQRRAADGTIVEKSGSLGELELPLSGDAADALYDGRTWSETVTIDGQPYLVVSVPSAPGIAGSGIVQAAGSVALLDQYLGGLRRSLMLLTAATVLVAFVSGWLVAGAALRPLENMTRTARRIGDERDFARRIAHTGPSDEVGQLAVTFNAMLDALQEAYDGLATALRRQRQFVADASHELRTPLTTIRGNSELLRRDPPISAGDQRAVVTDIVGETERLMHLVDELLTLARTDARGGLEIAPVSLAPVLVDLGRQIDILAPDRTVTIASGNGCVVLGNETALKQVLLNLLDNALKHAGPEAHVELSVSCRSDRVDIAVRDDGPGIDDAHVAHLFERFYRADQARTSPGSGLGLAIAKTLTEAQGGSIRVASEIGSGTTFTVTLPSLPGAGA